MSNNTGDLLQQLADREAIRERLYRYCRSMDRVDAPLGQSIFHEDATADYGPIFKGRGRDMIEHICAVHTRKFLHHSHQLLLELTLVVRARRLRLEQVVSRAGEHGVHRRAPRLEGCALAVQRGERQTVLRAPDCEFGRGALLAIGSGSGRGTLGSRRGLGRGAVHIEEVSPCRGLLWRRHRDTEATLGLRLRLGRGGRGG